MYFTVTVQTPTKLSDEQRELLKALDSTLNTESSSKEGFFKKFKGKK